MFGARLETEGRRVRANDGDPVDGRESHACVGSVIREPRLQVGQCGVEIRRRGGSRSLRLGLLSDGRGRSDGLRLLDEEEATDRQRDNEKRESERPAHASFIGRPSGLPERW